MTLDARYRHFDRRMERDHGRTWGHVHLDCRHAMFNYLVWGWEPGSFLTAVLTNDLYSAAARADTENVNRLAYVAKWVTHALPGVCYGSPEIIQEWQQKSARDREEILTACEILPTLFEVIKDPG